MQLANESPPVIQGYKLDTEMPLHRLAEKRIRLGRDLKIIVTAEDSQTGVGKTTAAGWLALTWTNMFAGEDWFVVPDEYGEGMGTLNPKEYFRIIGKIPSVYPAGTVVVVDDAEELDARRSMQNLNVQFSQRWMLMRLKQAITIITLPSPSSIDSRLEELADVWINITRRGAGIIHDIRVKSYGSRNVMTKKVMSFEFPDVSSHPELEKLRDMKEAKMASWDKQDEEEEKPDPEQVEKDTLKKTAQRLREQGKTVREIAEAVDMSSGWVSNHTEQAST